MHRWPTSSRRIAPLPLIVVALVLARVLVGRLVEGWEDTSRWWFAAGPVLLAAWWLVAVRVADRIRSLRPRTRRLVVVGAAALAYAATLRAAWAVARFPGFDAEVVYLVASDAAMKRESGLFFIEYFTKFPNNALLTDVYVHLFRLVRAIGGEERAFLHAIALLNAVLLVTATGCVVFTVRRLIGGTAAVFAAGLCVAFLCCSPWLHIGYSDTLGAFVVSVLVMLGAIAATGPGQGRRVATWSAIGVVGAFGVGIKPTVVFLLAALVAGLLIRRPVSGRRSQAWAAAGAAAVSFVAVHAACGAWIAHSEVPALRAASLGEGMPPTLWLAMGATGEGIFNPDDARLLEQVPPSERFGRAVELWQERVEDLGAVGYLELIDDKVILTLGDGSFGQYGYEGRLTVEPYVSQDALSRQVQAFYDIAGSRHGLLLGVWRGLWVGVTVAIVLFALRRLPRTTATSYAAWELSVALLALIGFHGVFEARARYAYLYAPVFITIASIAVASFRMRRWSNEPRPALESSP